MKITGYTLLELLCCIAIMAIIAVLSFSSARTSIEEQQLDRDAQLVFHTLQSAQNMAVVSQHEINVFYNDHDLKINNQHYKLSGKNHIVFHCFPQQKNESIRFSPDGSTSYQNGTILIHSPSGYQKGIILSQGGRLRMNKS